METMKTLPMMSFGEAIKTCFKKYATFSGRARRSEYWWFAMLNIILAVCTCYLFQWKMSVKAAVESQVAEALFDQEKMDAIMAQAQACDDKFFPLLCLIGAIALILLLPSLAVAVRRLHDTARPGWWIFTIFIPIVNFVTGILILIWTLQDSKPEDNRYGDSPKYVFEEV